jgi:hypothetical protein
MYSSWMAVWCVLSCIIGLKAGAMLELLNQLDGFEASNKIKVRRFAFGVECSICSGP